MNFCSPWRNKNPYDSDKDTLHFQWKGIIYSILKMLLVIVYSNLILTTCLIGSYNGIYLKLDKIQTRILAHPLTPNHYKYDHCSYFSILMSLCFKWKKMFNDSFTCLKKKKWFPLKTWEIWSAATRKKIGHFAIHKSFIKNV